ncbi:hypothetical protein ABH13_0229 [Bacillus velezensis]|nr:hypothetical protein ABH13_0229 [Bacillus velezensis]RAP14623.1 hypothetical protein C2W63_03856 [Bacillus velezensis]RUR96247.1 hypothetical protein EFW57_03747 [Bacillus velezensis]
MFSFHGEGNNNTSYGFSFIKNGQSGSRHGILKQGNPE